jgi:hypothetical protein
MVLLPDQRDLGKMEQGSHEHKHKEGHKTTQSDMLTRWKPWLTVCRNSIQGQKMKLSLRQSGRCQPKNRD